MKSKLNELTRDSRKIVSLKSEHESIDLLFKSLLFQHRLSWASLCCSLY